jgi:hypothetical protein
MAWLRPAANVVLLLVTLVVNGLANALPLNGRSTGEISDSFGLVFVPAGYVFSIWGLIYLALAGFVVYQALPAGRASPRAQAPGWWFALTCVANTLWIVFWHYGAFVLTLVAMLTLLGALIVIYRRLAAVDASGVRRTVAEFWLVQAPFSLYLGWITIATIANVSAVLVWAGWRGAPLPDFVWAVLLIAVAAALTLRLTLRFRDAVYAGVAVWALVGIAVAQTAYPPVVVAALAGAGVALAALVAVLLRATTRGQHPAIA